MLEEKIVELTEAIEALADRDISFDERTDVILDLIGTSLYHIAETLKKIEAKM